MPNDACPVLEVCFLSVVPYVENLIEAVEGFIQLPRRSASRALEPQRLDRSVLPRVEEYIGGHGVIEVDHLPSALLWALNYRRIKHRHCLSTASACQLVERDARGMGSEGTVWLAIMSLLSLPAGAEILLSG